MSRVGVGEGVHAFRRPEDVRKICAVTVRANLPPVPFYPHGFDLQSVGGIDYLYVINHYRDDLNTSSVLQFKINKENLAALNTSLHTDFFLRKNSSDMDDIKKKYFEFHNSSNIS
jgi:hypothetical protein